MEEHKVKNVFIVMIIAMFSKLLGFLRDIILANYFGASFITDAYFVAQTIPEFLFSLVVQAVAIGFIPIFTEILQKQGKISANRFVSSLLKISFGLAVLLIVFVNLFTSSIVSIFASGFDEDAVRLTVSFVRISVLAMLFRICVSIFSAYLNANNSFVVPAFNGIVLDAVVISSIFVAFFTNCVEILAWGIVLSTFAQFILLLPAILKFNFRFDFSFQNPFNSEIKQMLLVFFPVAIGVGANQLNVLADRTMASSISGAISALNYANKVNNIFENVIILSLATVIFPSFSKNIASSDWNSFRKNLSNSFALVVVAMIPCAILSFLFSNELITLLFGRGAFDSIAIENTSIAMKFYSIGLVFLSLNAILVRAFYSMKRIKITSFISCGTVAVNILMNFLLKPLMGVGGLALATSISNIFATVVLFLSFYIITKISLVKDIFLDLVKTFFAALGATLTIYPLYHLLKSSTHYLISMFLGILAFILIYSVIQIITKSSVYHFIFIKIKDIMLKNRSKTNE